MSSTVRLLVTNYNCYVESIPPVNAGYTNPLEQADNTF